MFLSKFRITTYPLALQHKSAIIILWVAGRNHPASLSGFLSSYRIESPPTLSILLSKKATFCRVAFFLCYLFHMNKGSFDFSAYFKKRRLRLKAEGFCTDCAKNKPEGEKTLCEAC